MMFKFYSGILILPSRRKLQTLFSGKCFVGSLWKYFEGSEKVTHDEEHHNLYSPPNIINLIKSRRLRQEGRGTDDRVYKNLFRNFEWKKPLGTGGCVCKDIISNVDLKNQSSCGAHPASYPMTTKGFLPGGKAAMT
jgi:hypothetical protein